MDQLARINTNLKRTEAVRDFANLCRVLAKNVGNPGGMEADLRMVSPRVKAAVEGATVGQSTWGDTLAYQTLTPEFMSLLSQRELFGQIPFRRVPTNTRTLLENTPGTAYWVGEGGGIPVTALSLDVVELPPFKQGALIIFTNELVQVGTPAGLDAITQAMIAQIKRFSDESLLNPDFSATSARPASLTNGASQVVSTGATEALITANLKSLLQVHVAAGSDLMDVYFVLHPQTALHLSQLLTAGNVRAFPEIGVRGGNIWGIPALTTTGAVCSGSPSEKVVVALNSQGCVVAGDGNIEITATNRAAIQMDDSTTQNSATGTATNVVSLFQTGSTAIKFVRPLNFARSHSNAVSFMRTAY